MGSNRECNGRFSSVVMIKYYVCKVSLSNELTFISYHRQIFAYDISLTSYQPSADRGPAFAKQSLPLHQLRYLEYRLRGDHLHSVLDVSIGDDHG